MREFTGYGPSASDLGWGPEDCNPDYCDQNHNGQSHEWAAVVSIGDPQEPTDRFTVCKYCGQEK